MESKSEGAKGHCSFGTCSLVLACAVCIVAIVLFFCDQYSMNWLQYFDKLADGIIVPL